MNNGQKTTVWMSGITAIVSILVGGFYYIRKRYRERNSLKGRLKTAVSRVRTSVNEAPRQVSKTIRRKMN